MDISYIIVPIIIAILIWFFSVIYVYLKHNKAYLKAEIFLDKAKIKLEKSNAEYLSMVSRIKAKAKETQLRANKNAIKVISEAKKQSIALTHEAELLLERAKDESGYIYREAQKKQNAIISNAEKEAKKQSIALTHEAESLLSEAQKKQDAIISNAEIEAKKQSIALTHEAELLLERAKDESFVISNKSHKDSEKAITRTTNEQNELVRKARVDAEKLVIPFMERIERLKLSDKEIVKRLKESRNLIEEISDLSCFHAANIEVINEEDLSSSLSYQEDRKRVSSKLKKLAKIAIQNVSGVNADVNIGKFIAISAKADMAGALLLTTVEMLCSKCTVGNAKNSFEKLFESIIACESLIKCMDSRAIIHAEFKQLLIERLEIEVNYKKSKQIQRDEQREIRELAAEERAVRKEAQEVLAESENEERIKRDAIAELEQKLTEQNESDKAAFKVQIEQLKIELELAHEKSERAKSRAQETKQGHVYIISNVGSFGEDILKIGMTRRLEPMDRVKELGDASVPFLFDVHALIESEDAPNLEKRLHKIFDSKRVNKVNKRKEYFYVNIDEIEEELIKLGNNILINKVASADQYYQSLKIASNQR